LYRAEIRIKEKTRPFAEAGLLYFQIRLYVEQEMHYVSVLYYVLLAFRSELSCGSACTFGS